MAIRIRLHRHEIDCVRTNQSRNGRNRITYVGGKRSDGRMWKLSVYTAIEGIEKGLWEFYVTRGSEEISVLVGLNGHGVNYLYCDGRGADLLLDLPECRY